MIDVLGKLEPVELYSEELINMGLVLVNLELISVEYYWLNFNPY